MDDSEQQIEELGNRLLLDHYRRRFEETENGVHAWKAWRLARGMGRAIPEWLFEFIDGCALELTTKASRGDGLEDSGSFEEFRWAIGSTDPRVIGSAEEQDREIAEAVGLGRDRGRTAFTRHALERRDRTIARRVRRAMERLEMQESEAVAAVSIAVKLDRRTVRAAFKRWDPVLTAPIGRP